MPEPSMPAIGNVVPGAMITEGETFQPTPRSRAASAPVPRVALPPRPLAPSKFSALIDRVVTLRNLAMLRPSSGMARASHTPTTPAAGVAHDHGPSGPERVLLDRRNIGCRSISYRSSAGMLPARSAVKIYQLLRSSGVLGFLVVTPPACEPGKPHRQPRLVFELPPTGGVVGRQCELRDQHLQHQARLEPHVSWNPRVDPDGPLCPAQRRQPCRKRAQFGVREPGAAPADRLVDLRVRVVRGQQHCPVRAPPPASPYVRADNDKVHGVRQFGAVVPFEFDPQPAAGTSLVDRARAGRLADQALRAVRNSLV